MGWFGTDCHIDLYVLRRNAMTYLCHPHLWKTIVVLFFSLAIGIPCALAQLEIPSEVPINRPRAKHTDSPQTEPSATQENLDVSELEPTSKAGKTSRLSNSNEKQVTQTGQDAPINSGPIQSGKWTGSWGKSNGTRGKFTLEIVANNNNELRAAGTVKGWTCWEVFRGVQDGNRLSLYGTGVIKNTRPADQYELDQITLHVQPDGTGITGRWTDKSGSSGDIDLEFSTSTLDDDREIQNALQF